MLNAAPVTNVAGRGRTLRLAFLSAVVSLVASFAASAAPIPLFNIYRAEDGFTNAGISLAVVAYSVGIIAALLVLGRLSNHLGRRPTAIASLGLLLLGCLLLLNVHDIGTLLAGRLLMGLGAGLASSSLTSYIVDAAPARPAWLASVASSQTPCSASPSAPSPPAPWSSSAPGHATSSTWLAPASSYCLPHSSPSARKPSTPTPGAWRSLRPRVRVPARVRHLLPVAAAVFLATCATGAFYQAFVPALVEDQLHTQQPAHPRTGVRRLHGPQRSRRSPRRPVHTSGSPTPRHDRLPGRNDRHHHSDRHRHTGVVHRRNHRRRRRSRHRHQRRHPRPAARQHPGRPGTDLQRDLPPLLQRRRLPQPHLRPTLQHLLATADRARIRRHLPSSPPCSLSSPHATRTPTRPRTARR